MNPISFYIRAFRKHAFALAKLQSHISFLQSCLFFGISPKGLTVKIPISGCNPSIHQPLLQFQSQQSLSLTHLILNLYVSSANLHIHHLFSFLKILRLSTPNFNRLIEPIVTRANQKLKEHAARHLKKLSSLLRGLLDGGVSLPVTQANHLPHQIPQPPLISSKPSLCHLLNIPLPASLPPRPNCIPPRNHASQNPNTVLNLSSKSLSSSQISVLSKGLTFSPKPRFNQTALVRDVLSFTRNLHCKYHFTNQTYHPPTDKSNLEPCLEQFRPPSQWDPPPLPQNHPLQTFQELLTSSVASQSFLKNLHDDPNLTPEETRAIRDLKADHSVVILPADKGSTTVVLDRDEYVAEGLRQLSDVSTYKPYPHNPIPAIQDELQKILKSLGPSQGLSPASIQLLTPPEPRTPTLYLLPKIHKPNHPGRPIVAGFRAPTERISALVDQHLQPIARSLPSYIKDTSHFLERLASIPMPLPYETFLVTIDVTSLYTNIPHAHGLSAVEHFLSQRPPETLPKTSFLLTLTNFILTHNFFTFEGQIYKQIRGTAMGTRMAPSYANLFMGQLETAFLHSLDCRPLVWYRFIDDIFMIWTHSEAELLQFLEHLNSFSQVKFTWSFSRSKATFLDVDIHLSEGRLHTSVHIKPTNKQQYLHFDSCHPFHIKRSLPYSLGLRGKRICSNPASLRQYTDNLTNAFTSRNYPTDLIHKQISRAISTSPQTHNPASKRPMSVPLLTQYYPGLEQLNSLLRQGYDFLKSCPEMRSSLSVILPTPPRVAFRRPPNLRNILVRPYDIPKVPSLPQGSYPCNRPRCKTCPMHPPTTTYSSPTTGKTYTIKGRATCESTHLIYQLTCNHCTAFYVGMTSNKLAIRMNGHRQTVYTGNTQYPVAEHALQHDIRDLGKCYTTRAIWLLPPNTTVSELRRWELALQHVLSSRHPPGLNLR